MWSIILYGISILFSPGPVTLLALNKGLNGQFGKSIGYFTSIGVATYCLLLFYGYAGEQLIKKEYLMVIGILGCSYMFFLSFKMFRHTIHVNDKASDSHNQGFKQGFLLQFFNPKASLAALPIATMQYPTHQITGISIAAFSAIFILLGFLSPALYCLIGQYFSNIIKTSKWLNGFNKIMASLLFVIALSILYDTVIIR